MFLVSNGTELVNLPHTGVASPTTQQGNAKMKPREPVWFSAPSGVLMNATCFLNVYPFGRQNTARVKEHDSSQTDARSPVDWLVVVEGCSRFRIRSRWVSLKMGMCQSGGPSNVGVPLDPLKPTQGTSKRHMPVGDSSLDAWLN